LFGNCAQVRKTPGLRVSFIRGGLNSQGQPIQELAFASLARYSTKVARRTW